MFEQLSERFWHAMETYQFATSGALLMALGAVMAWMRHVPQQIYIWVHRRIKCEMSVDGREPAFYWLKHWLSERRELEHVRRITASIKRDDYGRIVRDEEEDEEFTLPKIVFSPANGGHWMVYKRVFVHISKSSDRGEGSTAASNSNQGNSKLIDSYTVTAYTRDKEFLKQMMNDVRDYATPKAKSSLEIWTPAAFDGWSAKRMKLRHPSSLIMTEGQWDEALAAVERFRSSRKWYDDRGVPYRLGMLLYGPPGNGKSSFVSVLASELKLTVCVISLNQAGITDSKLVELFDEAPAKSILLIEDVDCAYSFRGTEKKDEKLSFSGLLNAIDGVSAQEGRILIMTTNHIEKLDGALIRPGRADMKLYFGNADHGMMQMMFLKFFPGMEEQAVRFAEANSDRELSMAEVQSHLMQNAKDAELALATPVEKQIDYSQGGDDAAKGLPEGGGAGDSEQPGGQPEHAGGTANGDRKDRPTGRLVRTVEAVFGKQ